MTFNLQFYITKPGFYINSKNKARQYLNNIIKAYKYVKKSLFIIQEGYIYSPSKVILYYRINCHYD